MAVPRDQKVDLDQETAQLNGIISVALLRSGEACPPAPRRVVFVCGPDTINADCAGGADAEQCLDGQPK